MALVLSLVVGGCRKQGTDQQPKTTGREATEMKEYTIWPKPEITPAPPGRTPAHMTIAPGRMIARPFKSPAFGRQLSGSIYIVGIDTGGEEPLNMAIMNDESGKLGHTTLCSTEVLVQVPPEKISGNFVLEVPFSLDCPLQEGEYYWLAVSAAWEEAILLRDESDPHIRVSVDLAEYSESRNSTCRQTEEFLTFPGGAGPGPGDWNCNDITSKLYLLGE